LFLKKVVKVQKKGNSSRHLKSLWLATKVETLKKGKKRKKQTTKTDWRYAQKIGRV